MKNLDKYMDCYNLMENSVRMQSVLNGEKISYEGTEIYLDLLEKTWDLLTDEEKASIPEKARIK